MFMFTNKFVKHRSRFPLIAVLVLVGTLNSIATTGTEGVVTHARGPSNIVYNTGQLTAPAALDWQIETISTAYAYDTIQFGVSLALDKRDRPRISYYDSGSGDLIYASRGTSTWQNITVDSGGNVGMHTSLALDTTDNPHISYYDVSNLHLKYAHYDGSDWTSDTVDSADYTGQSTSIALDSADNPHVSYYRGGSCGTSEDLYCNLRYADYNGSWNPLRVHHSTAKLGQFTSLAMDTNDYPHISYYHADNGQLRYLYHNGSAWQWGLGVVDSGGVGADTSLALDANDRPHISYVGNGDLLYAHYNGTRWITETVDSAGSVGRSTSLALDSAEQPHISYYDLSNDTLKYAYYDGSQWQIDAVAGTGDVHGYEGTSLELTSMDLPHINYYTTSGVRYAYVETKWVYLPLALRGYPAPPERYAVIIGVADYMYDETPPPGCFLDDLPYPDEDAQAMQQVLLSYGDFEASNILTLVDYQATKAAIQDAITNWLASRAAPQDTVVIYYVGHGGQLGDVAPYDDEADGVDEWLIPSDWSCDTDSAISDDELDTWLDTVNSQHMVLFFDSCFSGGMFSAAAEGETPCRSRCLPPPPGVIVRATAQEIIPMDVGQSGRLVLTASREDQESFECDSLRSGVFSYYLRQALQNAAADTSSNGWVSGEEAYVYLKPLVESEMCYQPWLQNPQIDDGTSGEEDVTQP